MNVKYNGKFLRKTVLFCLTFVGIYSFSQDEAQLSLYMFHQPSYNPAFVGDNGMINITGQQRIQWVGVPGAPQTTYFTANMPFRLGNINNGFGIKFLIDQTGLEKRQTAGLQYAWKKNIGKGVLSTGFEVGFIGIVALYADSLKSTVNSEYHEPDDHVPTQNENGMGLDLTAGISYSAEKYYFAVSAAHINQPKIALGDKYTRKINPTLFITGGYDYVFGNPKFILRSNSLLKFDLSTMWQADISTRMEYDKRLWGGLSYRYQEAVVAFAGFTLLNGFRVGYAYDIPVGNVITYRTSYGTHEFFVNYGFALDLSKNKNKYKSIRIL